MTSLLALAVVGLSWDNTLPTEPLPRMELTDVAGKTWTLPVPEAKATVLVFISVDCPIANRYAPEIKRVADEFGPKGVAMFRVYWDATVANADMVKHGEEFGYGFPGFVDHGLKFVKAVGATVTPEAAVIGVDGKVKYRGRINDMYLEHGRIKPGEYRQDLRVAIEEVLAGKTVTEPVATAIGCGIPID